MPEPELGLAIGHQGDVVGYFVGNDVTSRSIEGENPLYLPQAKSFTGSCALGPCLVPLADAPPIESLEIELVIERGGSPVYTDQVLVDQLRRTPSELAAWLFRAMDFPMGVMLLTGTAIVPPDGFSLQAGDAVTVTIDGIGTIRNPVVPVGDTTAGGQAAG